MADLPRPPSYREKEEYGYFNNYGEKPTMSTDQPPSAKGRQAWGKKTPEEGDVGEAGEPGAQPDATPSWRDFTQNTTFHGIKYVFDGSSLVRRLFWLSIVLGAVGFFVSQVALRTINYYKYQTVLSVKRTLTEEVNFPAITLCNLNQFRITKAEETKLYDCFNTRFRADKSDETSAACEDLPNTIEIIAGLGHQMQQLIDNCWWQGEECNMEEDFIMRLTDIGICFTFNHNSSRQKSVIETGAFGGLQLLLNIEQYEHMRGPNMDSGVKFLLHDPKEFPSLKDMGFVATPGEHTFVAIKHTKMSSLPYPWGDCIDGGDPVSLCKQNCFRDSFLEMCGCTDVHMPGHPDYPLCSLQQRFKCPCNQRKKMGVSSCSGNCSCLSPCQENIYKPTLSSSLLSRINLNTFALIGEGKKDQTNATFIKATETQLYLGDKWSEYIANAKMMVDSHNALHQRLLKYNFSSSESAMHYLRPFSKALLDDEKLLSPELLDTLLPPMACSDITENFSDIYLYFMKQVELIVAGYEAIQLDNDNCSHPDSDWVEPELECEEKVGKGRDRAVFESKAIELKDDCAGQYAAECGEDHGECSCKFAGLFNKYGGELLDAIPYLLEIYKADLKTFTDVGDLNASKFADVQKHQKCMSAIDSLQLTGYGAMAAVRNQTSKLLQEPFPSNDYFRFFIEEAYEELMPIPDILNQDIMQDEYRSICCWMDSYVVSVTGADAGVGSGDQGEAEKSDTINKLIHAIDMMDGINVDTLHDDVEDLEKEDLWSKIVDTTPTINEMSKFINLEVTTRELSSYLMVPKNQRFMRELVTASGEFKLDLEEIIEDLRKVYRVIDEYIDLVHNQMMIPLIWESHLDASKLRAYASGGHFQTAMATYVTDSCANEEMTSLKSPEWQLLAKYICSTIEYLESDVRRIERLKDQLETSSATFLQQLSDFHERSEMDEDFYMENFLQVDLYYEELQYETVEEQKAFVLGSLFSEVGGFLGLLLGASVMTMCELVDYLILLWGRRQQKKAAIQALK